MPDENRFAGLSEAVDEDEENPDGPADDDREVGKGESADTKESVDSTDSQDSLNIVESADIVEGEGGRNESSSAGGDASQNSTSTDDETRDMNGSNAVDGEDETEDVDAGGSKTDTDSSNIVESSDIVNSTDTPESANIPESVGHSESDCDDDPAPADAGSAFGFDDTEQHSVYVRPDAWQEFEDAEALVDARLRAEHNVRDLTGREFHDAVLRVASEHEDELVEAILAARMEE